MIEHIARWYHPAYVQIPLLQQTWMPGAMEGKEIDRVQRLMTEAEFSDRSVVGWLTVRSSRKANFPIVIPFNLAFVAFALWHRLLVHLRILSLAQIS